MLNFVMRFPEGKDRAFTLSYDDGILADRKLVELARKYSACATFNIPSSFVDHGDPNRLSPEELRSLAADDHFEIAAHGRRHPFYTLLPESAVLTDILTDREALENMTGRIIRGFALPNGPYTPATVDCLRLAGAVYSRTTRATRSFELPADWLEWHPTCHHRNALELVDEFLNMKAFYRIPPVFYVWGHTFEFENENNWDLMETLLQKITAHANVWLATNMMIYDYVNAWKNLVYSADGERVYNPTLTDLWGAVKPGYNKEGTLVHVPSGKSVNIRDALQ